MLTEKRSTKFGAALIIFAIIFRLIFGVLEPVLGAARQSEETRGTLLRPTTGAVAPPAASDTTTAPLQTEPPLPERTPVCFTAEDLQYIRVQYAQDCAYRPSLESLLQQPLGAAFSTKNPAVLIIHTHATESYTRQPGQSYAETADYRTLDTDFNMVSLGEQLAQLLTAAGITVIHDRQLHDYPSYTAAYSNSRESARAWLQENPQICMVLDLHRDAALNADGSQYATKATLNGKTVAQLMLVVGTDASGNYHPGWQDNLSAALKLQVLLEKQAPGITRQTILRAQRFNHDLSAGAMIVEVGTAGNTLEEAAGAIPVLAQALITLLLGEEGVTEASTSAADGCLP